MKRLIKSAIIATGLIGGGCGAAFLIWWLSTGSLIAFAICISLLWMITALIFYCVEKGD